MENVKTNASSHILISNWHNYDSEETIRDFIEKISSDSKFNDKACFLALPYVYLETFSKQIKPGIVLGCNRMNSVLDGSFTSSTAAEMLKNSGAAFVIVGSADNRRYFGETNPVINLKIKKALDSGIIPILSIGETLQESQSGQSTKILSDQILEGLKDILPEQLRSIIILFEAPWLNITPIRPDGAALMKTYSLYHQIIDQVLGPDVAKKLKVIYAFPNDFNDLDGLMEQVDVNGFYLSKTEFFTHSIGLHNHLESKTKEKNSEITASSQDLNKPQEAKPLQENQPSPEKDEEAAIKHEPKKDENFVNQAEIPSKKTPEEASIRVEENADFVKNETEEYEEAIESAQIGDELPEQVPSAANLSSNKKIDETFTPTAKSVKESPEIKSEEIPAFDDNTDSEIEEEALPEVIENNNTEDFLKELTERAAKLVTKNKTISDNYDHIKQDAAIIPKIKKEFDPLLEKMLSKIDRLPSEVQEAIRQGDVNYFQTKKANLGNAREVLMDIQKLNELLEKVSAVPPRINKLITESRKIRTELEKEWAYFNANRKSIREQLPNFVFPQAPSQLSVREPEVDLSAKAVPQNKFVLSSKRLAIVSMKS